MTVAVTRKSGACVALAISAILAQAALAQEAGNAADSTDDVAELSDVEVTDSALGSLAKEISGTSFGFSKPLLETPRSVSFISTEQIDLFGVSSVADLTRVVPGVFTTTRFGFQGAINVRGVPADTYYRGMKRLTMQGHTRTVLGSMDSIEVVKGPPSPIFGMGKIGGYTNLNPKSGRAKLGGYLEESQGFGQTIIGSYDKGELQFGVGGPASVFGKRGGYYVYSLLEDSDQYVDQVKVRQKYFQGQMSLDNAIGPFRLEFGTQYQHSQTNGQSLTRVTKDVVDSGRYIAGSPLANLDVNGDGRIGYVEMHQASPVRGNIGQANQPLVQRWAWPRDANGVPLEFGQFPTVSGIPVTMLQYLNAHPEVNCRAADVMRSMSAGSPLPTSGQLPVGFVLNPCTVSYQQVDIRANPSFEKDQDGVLILAYVDLIWDVNPDLTLKNQMFVDTMDQHKNGDQPFNEYQDIYAVENKTTLTYRVPADKLPTWARVNTLSSLNFRYNHMERETSGGDYYHRNDATVGMGRYTSNTAFWTPGDDPSYSNGYPFTSINSTQFSETGLGLLFDIDLFSKTNIVLGGRYDYVRARNTDYGAFNFTTGTSANPGRFNTTNATATGSDTGASYSVSVSHQLPGGFRPYATYAVSSLTLTGSSQQLSNATINSGSIGEAELKEAGIKASFLQDRLFLTASVYEQTRNDVTEPDDPSFGAEVTSTITRGVELEAKWQATRNLFLAAYALFEEAKYLDLPVSANISVSGSTLGFQDVLDPLTGELLYPADAFLWGGRPALIMPADVSDQYRTRWGNPQDQYGLNGNYKLRGGFGLAFSANYFSSVFADRLKYYELPSVALLNTGITWDRRNLHAKFDVFNVTNERWFQVGGDATNDRMIVQPDRRWQLSLRMDF